MPARAYVGRFAPSPTGALHFGSVVAAIGSYLDAHAHQGRWLLRIDDLDTPRNSPGAVTDILRELQRLQLNWDAAPWYQSQHPEHYREALHRLSQRGLSYPCACSRKALAAGAYPGTCRNGLAPGQQARSQRLRVADKQIEFNDLIQGSCVRNLAEDPGDFIILRGDGITAYHLATVLDDAAAGISRVVRGADLIDSTPRQIHLQKCLGVTIPEYAHLPVAVNRSGKKLSKQSHAQPSHNFEAQQLWRSSLEFLGQPTPPLDLREVRELREFGLQHWHLERVPAERETERRTLCMD